MNSDDLKRLTQEELLDRTRKTVAEERRIHTDILKLLQEVDRRRLYAKLGFRSLFDFCVKELKYSESSAWRRISAMKLMCDLPEIEEKICSGSLTLSNATSIQNFIRTETNQTGRPVSLEQKKSLLESVENKTAKDTQRILASLSPTAPPRESARPLTRTQTEIRFVADEPLFGKLERLKDLNSHRDPSRSYSRLFDWLSEIGLRQTDPLLKRTPTAGLLTVSSTRAIPVPLRQSVWKRDRGQCTYLDPKTGRRCGSTRFVEIDHIFPIGLGGKTELGNLRLYCRTHNQLAALQTFGESKIRSESNRVMETRALPEASPLTGKEQ